MERYFLFNDVNTFKDWKLIVTSKTITPPEPKTNHVEIAGMDGSLDLSEALTDRVTYKDRTISATFWSDYGNRSFREKLKDTIINTLHGKKMKIIEPDDPNHYFYGRIIITEVTNKLAFLTFSIKCKCEPWRYALQDTTKSSVITTNNTSILYLHNDGIKTLVPKVIVNGLVTIMCDDATFEKNSGEYKLTDLKLYPGANVVTITGNGKVIFTYREASL